MTKEIAEDADLARSQITSSNLDDTCKKQLLRLVNLSTMATNGISVEEKIQKITEAIQGLVVSQVMFINYVDNKVMTANRDQCKNCKAMAHAEDVEQKQKQEEIIAAWQQTNGYPVTAKGQQAPTNAPQKPAPKSATMMDTVKEILVKPYFWVFGSLLVFSPYGVEIVKAILAFCSK